LTHGVIWVYATALVRNVWFCEDQVFRVFGYVFIPSVVTCPALSSDDNLEEWGGS
jgi:hypothetical protein